MKEIKRPPIMETGIRNLAFIHGTPFKLFFVIATMFEFVSIVTGQNPHNASSEKTIQGQHQGAKGLNL